MQLHLNYVQLSKHFVFGSTLYLMFHSCLISRPSLDQDVRMTNLKHHMTSDGHRST